MTSTGKAARSRTGLNRHELHRASHSITSPEKVTRAGWRRNTKKSTNHRKGNV